MSNLLIYLIAHASRIGGCDLCADGHDWKTDGARPCPWGLNDGAADHHGCNGSQAAERCARCGDYDYGEPGGPGFTWCLDNCDELRGLTPEDAAELMA